jgi:hypothetical protein
MLEGDDASFFRGCGCLSVVGAEYTRAAHKKDLAGGDASSPDGRDVRAELACVDCCRYGRSTNSLIRSEHSRETPEDDQLVETSSALERRPSSGHQRFRRPGPANSRTLGGQIPS